MTTKPTIRKQAQRAIPLNGEKCSNCGSLTSLTRHHQDYSKPLDVVIMCRSCHSKHHGKESSLKPKKCQICGSAFTPARSDRAMICSNPECLKAIGKLSASKRWENRDSTATCQNCGLTFAKKRARQTACSRSCANKIAWRKRQCSTDQ